MTGAEVLLRIEDHDAQRSRPDFEAALLDDLDWLGFVPDRFPTLAFRAGRCDARQSDRAAIYAEVASTLLAHRLVYACRCSRQDLAAGESIDALDGERRYAGTCRARNEQPGPGVAWRLRLEPAAITFEDLLTGVHLQTPSSQCGDVLIRDRLGNWTYQFAVTVDDLQQDIDLVVRGRDLLASTGRQIQIGGLIGRPTPARFAHHSLLMQSATQKLSKSDGATGVRDLRAAGWSAARVIGHAAWRAGLSPTPADLTASAAAALLGQGVPAPPRGATL